MKNVEVNDLRSAIEMLESIPGQLVETGVEVDPNAELSGVYRHVGAGGTVERPTQEGPAMIFNNVKGHEGARVAIGVLSSRKRVGYLLGEDPIMQTCIGPVEEHVSMAGIPTEASILAMVDKALPGKCLNVYNASFGGGKYVTIMQFKKTLEIKANHKHMIINVADILYIKASVNDCYIHVTSGSVYKTRSTLEAMEAQVGEYFLR